MIHQAPLLLLPLFPRGPRRLGAAENRFLVTSNALTEGTWA
jgi:hypothetical protein